ncbi:Vanillyl-alcohol oxidase [Pestalotiopsis fici W106-1]|uniref:Vanillyl-alcohol oxidase n=1 Tax=Pestalotiopsis fici (strain W106-1 / CGMCC3.15140) TaxID=1229662 RepID=W3XJJ6_PESFW|nr:Vanillyl-alcohol oxidase [Pestalotiopsis fici W106-1]ETS86189.1 Vanillyl-alcohol oxidase [Pestalotiopsis fici W106-1]
MEEFRDPFVLPPSVDREKFHEFISRAAQVVGIMNIMVISDPSQFSKQDYMDSSKSHDMFHVLEKEEFLSSAVVMPRQVPDVQDMMRLANEFEIPVWPFSTGRNIGYGGAAPRVRGSVALDLGRHMNRILEVNTDAAYALVEPGVSYFDLHDYLVKNNLRKDVWMDVPDLGGGSLIGNTLERGIGYTPYGDHWMMHCGLEVVLPDGSLIRTGMGALPNPQADKNKSPHEQEWNKSWQLFNYGFGPYNDGIFSQSSLGVVVKMGVSLMMNPGGFQSYLITFPRNEDLHKIVEIMRPLRISLVIQNAPKLESILVAAALAGPRTKYTSSEKLLDDQELDNIAEQLNLGRWNLYGALYGPQVVRDSLWSVIKSSFGNIPGAKFFFLEDRPDDLAMQTRNTTFQGIPTISELEWVNWLPNGSHLFFSPIAPVTGDEAQAQYQLTRQLVQEHGFDFIGSFLVGLREMHHIVCIVFDRKDDESRRRAYTLIKTLIAAAAARGWGEYRAHLALMDEIAGTYSFNDNAQMKLNEKLKNALDPKGILAPGKNGVWPANYKKEEWVMPH